MRLDLVRRPEVAIADWRLNDVRHAVILANLDHVVAVVALLKHLPEVDRQAVDLLRLVKANLVVVRSVAVIMLNRSLLVYFLCDWLVVYGAGMRALFLHKLSPMCYPF